MDILFFIDEKLEHSGWIKPGAKYGWDSIETAVEALSFMLVKPGDTDTEFFENHSQAHLEWLETATASELGTMLYNYEAFDSYSNSQRKEHGLPKKRNKIFKPHFQRF